MVEQNKYSIISISEDEDDVVIQAGDTSRAFAQEPERSVSQDGARLGELEDDCSRGPAPSQVDAKSAARKAELERLRQAEEALKAKAPFPAMRAAIFAVAIVLLALAFVWLTFIR